MPVTTILSLSGREVRLPLAQRGPVSKYLRVNVPPLTEEPSEREKPDPGEQLAPFSVGLRRQLEQRDAELAR
jgi:hypothetical protein